jgi:hypothetical protein
MILGGLNPMRGERSHETGLALRQLGMVGIADKHGVTPPD